MPRTTTNPSRGESVEESAGTDWPALTALRTPAFWAFGLATAFYALVSSALFLFGEKVLAELGLGREVFLSVEAVTFLFGVVCNLLCGWLALKAIKKNPTLSGSGRAWFGIVFGGLMVVVQFVLAVAVLIAGAAQRMPWR